MANLIVTTDDGMEHLHFQETRKGDPEDPMSDAELIEKYDELSSGVIPKSGLDQIKSNILWGNELPGKLLSST